ncbi:hypothetical protein ACH5RR_033489 [Cinchona calisaya]|uniref:RING-type domain-containing protein n=1 Tax=Cinchona calisaya TaxID=153742 RepID=A0ABD2YL39_9GENT
MAIKSVVASPIDASLAPDCSICLEKVVDDNSQAIAKLKCGHLFHMCNIRNVVYPDHAQTPHHSFLGPIFPPLAPQSMPFHASNATMSIGLASSILNHRPPVTLRPNGYAPYPLLSFGVHHGSSPATSFSSPNVAARSHILYGRAPPPSSTQAPLARTEAHWAPPCDLNLIRIGPLLHQGGLTRRRANNNAVHDPLALTLATGTFMAAAHPRMIN